MDRTKRSSELGRVVSVGCRMNNQAARIVFDRARAIAGDAAIIRDEDTGDVWLRPDWAAASTALLCAALAPGAPELMPEADRELLVAAVAHAFPESG